MRIKRTLRKQTLAAAGAVWLLTGCGGSGSQNTGRANANVPSATRLTQLPLPEVPDSIADPEERVAYAAVHFWDALDPADHTQSLDTALMEQTFANFLAVLPYSGDDDLQRAVKAFADRCSADTAVYELAVNISRQYLDDPNSPMRNEELYIPFLERFATDRKLADEKRARAAYRLEQAHKNRPGRRAADFRMETRDGRIATLYSELRDTTLVYFYDHDCEYCKETTARLSGPSAGLRYPVIAVEVTENREGWESTKAGMPAGWTVAIATEGIDGEKYYFPALPSGYLLAPDGTVLIKDAGL